MITLVRKRLTCSVLFYCTLSYDWYGRLISSAQVANWSHKDSNSINHEIFRLLPPFSREAFL